MKTLTEFSGVTLRSAHEARQKLLADGVDKEQLTDAVGEAIAVSGDRLARLIEALDVVGDRVDKARLVRVYQGETAPAKAKTVGEFHYVVDMIAAAPKGGRDARGGRGGGRDGRGGGGGRGAPRRDGPFGGGGGERREREPRRGEVPSAGAGWTLTPAPGSERDGRPKGKPKRKPPRRTSAGAKPSAGRAGQKPAKPGTRSARPGRPPAKPGAKPAKPGAKTAKPGETARKPARSRNRRGGKARSETTSKTGTPKTEPTVEYRKTGVGPPKKKRSRNRRRNRDRPSDSTVEVKTTAAPTPTIVSQPETPAKPRRIISVAEAAEPDAGKPDSDD